MSVDPNSTNKVLYCGQLPTPDPLLNLPTPATALGVDPADRGAPQATNTNLMPNDPSLTNKVLSSGMDGFDPDWDNPDLASITINAGMHVSPIDRSDPALVYDPQHMPDESLDGMLFFQRRRNTKAANIEGNSVEGDLIGTIYAKWAPVKITGSGTYDAQFVIGSLEVAGTGVVTVDYAGKKMGKAPQVFLVE